MVLRLGLSAVFLWFGFSQVLDGQGWIGWVPVWATNFSGLSPEAIVFGNGLFEVVFGLLLITGFWMRYVAGLLALHMALITLGVGFNEIGVRDFGLTAAVLALALLSSDSTKEHDPSPELMDV